MTDQQMSKRAQEAVTAGFTALAITLILFLILTSCSTPDAALAQTNLDNLDTVGPEYLEYVDADSALNPAQQEDRHRTIRIWRSVNQEALK